MLYAWMLLFETSHVYTVRPSWNTLTARGLGSRASTAPRCGAREKATAKLTESPGYEAAPSERERGDGCSSSSSSDPTSSSPSSTTGFLLSLAFLWTVVAPLLLLLVKVAVAFLSVLDFLVLPIVEDRGQSMEKRGRTQECCAVSFKALRERDGRAGVAGVTVKESRTGGGRWRIGKSHTQQTVPNVQDRVEWSGERVGTWGCEVWAVEGRVYRREAVHRTLVSRLRRVRA